MAERRMTVLDTMVLLAALAVGLALTSKALRAMTWQFAHLALAARGDLRLDGKTADELIEDPDASWAVINARGCSLRERTIHDLAVDPHLAWTFSEGAGQYLDFSRLPGTPNVWWTLFDLSGPRLSRRIAIHTVEMWPLLMTLSMAVVALRVRRPRPRWQDLLSQPGLWACLAPVVALLTLPAVGYYFTLRLSPLLLSGPVGVAWLGLAVSRRWHTDPAWVDRAGRALGVCWLFVLLIGTWAATRES